MLPVRLSRDGNSIWLSAQHAPPGGIQIAGRFFPGGRFIPAADVANASPEEKARLDQVHGERKDALKATVGDTDRDTLRGVLEPHDHPELKAHQVSQARRTFSGIKSYHGELTLHRLHQMIHQDVAALAKATGPKRDQLLRRIAGYKHMLDWHESDEKATKAAFAASKTGVHVVKPSELHADPTRFQYKLNTNKEGVVREGSATEGVQKWNPDFGGVLHVWHDPADGKDYVINGHHRLALAKKLGADDLTVRYLDAKTAEEARTRGALINIAEGHGTAVDAAKFLRDTKSTLEELAKEGVAVKGQMAKDAQVLSGLADPIFSKVALGTLDMKRALAIGQIKDQDAQIQFHSYLEKLEDAGKAPQDYVINEMAKEANETPSVEKGDAGGGGMFGDLDDETHNLFLERNQLKASIKRKLATERNVFGVVGKEKKAAELQKRAKNVLDVEENKKIAADAEAHRNLFDQEVNLRGPLRELVDRHAEDYYRAKTAKQRKAVEEKLYDEVIPFLSGAVSRGTVGGVQGSGEGDAGSGSPPVEQAAAEVAPAPAAPKKPAVEPVVGSGKPELTHQAKPRLGAWKGAPDPVARPAKQEQTHKGGPAMPMPSAAQVTKPKEPEPAAPAGASAPVAESAEARQERAGIAAISDKTVDNRIRHAMDMAGSGEPAAIRWVLEQQLGQTKGADAEVVRRALAKFAPGVKSAKPSTFATPAAAQVAKPKVEPEPAAPAGAAPVADSIASAYDRAASLSDDEMKAVGESIGKASKDDLQAALKKMGFVFKPSDSRAKLAKDALQWVTSRNGATRRVGLINRNPFDKSAQPEVKPAATPGPSDDSWKARHQELEDKSLLQGALTPEEKAEHETLKARNRKEQADNAALEADQAGVPKVAGASRTKLKDSRGDTFWAHVRKTPTGMKKYSCDDGKTWSSDPGVALGTAASKARRVEGEKPRADVKDLPADEAQFHSIPLPAGAGRPNYRSSGYGGGGERGVKQIEGHNVSRVSENRWQVSLPGGPKQGTPPEILRIIRKANATTAPAGAGGKKLSAWTQFRRPLSLRQASDAAARLSLYVPDCKNASMWMRLFLTAARNQKACLADQSR